MQSDVRQAKEVLFAAVKDASANSFLHWAAAIAFYAILSFAPLVFIVITVTSFFVDSGWAAERMTQLLGKDAAGRVLGHSLVENGLAKPALGIGGAQGVHALPGGVGAVTSEPQPLDDGLARLGNVALRQAHAVRPCTASTV